MYGVPACTLALLMRESLHVHDPDAEIPLSEIEKIDHGLIVVPRQQA